MAPKAQADSTDVATDDALNGEVSTPTVHDKFAEYMALYAKANTRDAGDAQDSISERLLTAESEEDIWDADEGEMPSAEDLVNIPIRIFSFDVLTSNDPGKQNARTGNTYLVIHSARLDNGDMLDWNTSATLIVQKLMRMYNKGFLDPSANKYLDAMVTSTRTGNGFDVYKLARFVAPAS
jgi:hypothetical protein